MWPFKKKLKQRRLEVRKNIPAAGPAAWRRFRSAGGVVAVLLVAMFYLGVLLMDVWPLDPMLLRAGQFVPADIHARLGFHVPSEQVISTVPSKVSPTTAATTAPRTQAADIGPDVVDSSPPVVYEPGQLLVPGSRRLGDNGEKIVGLSDEGLKLLRCEHEAYRLDQRSRPWRLWGRVAGRGTVLLLVTLMLCIYIVRYQSRIVRNHWRGLAVTIVILLMLAINKAMVVALRLNPQTAVLPVMITAIILTIAYDQRFALVMGSAVAFFAVLQVRGDFSILIVLLASMAASVFGLREIRTRSKLIEVTAGAGGIVFVAVWANGLFAAVPWRFVLADSLWGAGFAMLVGFLVQGILPLIERVFRIATSMTLLEWCDASKPLLKRLAMEAPGTYNHSLQLGTMSELAAESIGARGLLSRVGAYYHDIGKINKPSYFVENEAGSASKHAKLSPAMSLLIIIGHVKDGLELAKEYSLPPVLQEFITTHHGTTLVQYFYHAAAEQHKTDLDRAPDEVEFRYPGPKPPSKEAAILMLADAAESSIRAMSEPTPGRIENQVHAIANHRLTDGQFDECELTLKEVHQIEVSLTKSLCSIYHARIAYPAPTEQKPSTAERRTAKRNGAAKNNAAKPDRPPAEAADKE